MTTLLKIVAAAGMLALGTPAHAVIPAPANLLADPGFESGMVVPSAVGGWNVINGAAFSQDYARSGQWSMRSPFNSATFNAPAVQYVPATPGGEYALDAWGFTPTVLDATQRAFLVIFFSDSNGSLLGNITAATVEIDSASPANTWIEMAVSATAPDNAAFVYAELSLFNFSSGSVPPAAVYFDDVSLTAVPEPSSLALIGLGAGFWILPRRRRCSPKG
jgi:hypothetical protein